MLMTRPECGGMELDQLEEFLCEANSDLEKSFSSHQFEIQLGIGRPNQVEVFGGHSCYKKLSVQRGLVIIEDKQKEAHDVFHDSFPLEVSRSGFQVALEQIQKDCQQIDIVFTILELLDDFADKNNYQLGHSV